MGSTFSPKVGAFYLLSAAILTYYGIEVCPFLEQLDAVELGGVLVAAFFVSGTLRGFVFRYLEKREAGSERPVDFQKPWRYLNAVPYGKQRLRCQILQQDRLKPKRS